VVFDRNLINLAAGSPDPDALLKAMPHSVITSVHEEWQDADLFMFVPTPVPDPANPSPLARDVFDFTVFIAGGSHATYLTPGDHDLVDFGDYWGGAFEYLPDILVVLGSPIILVVAIILSIIEHFVDTEDFTSEDGVHGVPPDQLGGLATGVATHVNVLPMTLKDHIYKPTTPDEEKLLALRAYAGKWGGHNGTADKSHPFTPKTARYLRKLLDKL
jgi:hypothetical protein